MSRAQVNFVALGVALLLVTVALGAALGAGTSAFAAADDAGADREAAAGVAARLVAADGPLTVRRNVLDADAVATFDAAALRASVPAARDRAVRVTLDGRPVVSAGDPDGPTVRRLVLVERRRTESVALAAGPNRTVVLPPTAGATLTIDPGTGVRAIRANGSVVRRDPEGVAGTVHLDLPRARPSRVTVNASGPIPPDAVEVTYYPWRTEPAALAVTVDA